MNPSELDMLSDSGRQPFSCTGLTLLYGKVNQMSRNELISNLKRLNLNPLGSREVLTKRLKNYYKFQKLSAANALPIVKLAPYYVVMDFEATCNIVNAPDYPHEIIEFPAVLISSQEKKIVCTFQSYVRPEINPVLSDFCVELTGITQEMVDKAETFLTVLKNFEDWMKKNGLGTKNKFIIVTDGPWDMAQFLHGQCQVSNIAYPHWAKKWLNIRKVFKKFYNVKHCNLNGMLTTLGLEFQGRPHCGLDDARNIAEILLTLMQENVPLHINERLELRHYNVRRKALLAAATAIVEKRVDGVDEASKLLERLKLASNESADRKKNKVLNSPSSKTESCQDELEDSGKESSDGEDSITWTDNKFLPLRKQRPA